MSLLCPECGSDDTGRVLEDLPQDAGQQSWTFGCGECGSEWSDDE